MWLCCVTVCDATFCVDKRCVAGTSLIMASLSQAVRSCVKVHSWQWAQYCRQTVLLLQWKTI